MITGHGDDRYRYGEVVRHDFSSNVPYRNHAAEIIDYLSSRLECLSHYPDPNATALRKLLADRWHLEPEWIVVTNGSTEAFYLLAHLFAGGRTLITVPSFAEYEDACQLFRHQITYIPTRDIERVSEPAQLLWTALPNNPDGEIRHRAQILGYCSRHPESYVIVDEAYAELCDEPVSLLGELPRHPNLILARSLTKSFALPGIRLGYLVAHPALLRRLEPLRSPWSVNALALEAGRYICHNYDRLLPDAFGLVAESHHLAECITECTGSISITPSPTPYFLAQLATGTAAQLKEELVTQQGILIRNADNFRTLTPRHFRLSVQSPEACQALLRGLSKL